MNASSSNSRRPSSQTLTAFTPLCTTLSVSARRKPSEISSRTQSVSAFLIGRIFLGPRYSSNIGGLVSRPPVGPYHHVKEWLTIQVNFWATVKTLLDPVLNNEDEG
jgi:hypothetical protein